MSGRTVSGSWPPACDHPGCDKPSTTTLPLPEADAIHRYRLCDEHVEWYRRPSPPKPETLPVHGPPSPRPDWLSGGQKPRRRSALRPTLAETNPTYRNQMRDAGRYCP